VAYTLYLVLVRDWGPSRAGSYAFISPAIAVVLGIVVLGEQMRATDAFGMAVMLAAAWLAVRGSGARKERAAASRPASPQGSSP
jgi:drug/metabolite transporter (DMT)-like permease